MSFCYCQLQNFTGKEFCIIVDFDCVPLCNTNFSSWCNINSFKTQGIRNFSNYLSGWHSRKRTQSVPEGPCSRLATRNTTMHTNCIQCMQNPSLVQCLQSFYSNYTSEDTKTGEQSPPWRIKTVMSFVRPILEVSLRPSAIAHCIALV